jgi:hypothetical protein
MLRGIWGGIGTATDGLRKVRIGDHIQLHGSLIPAGHQLSPAGIVPEAGTVAPLASMSPERPCRLTL